MKTKHHNVNSPNKSNITVTGHDAVAECGNCGKQFSYLGTQSSITWECPYCKTPAQIDLHKEMDRTKPEYYMAHYNAEEKRYFLKWYNKILPFLRVNDEHSALEVMVDLPERPMGLMKSDLYSLVRHYFLKEKSKMVKGGKADKKWHSKEDILKMSYTEIFNPKNKDIKPVFYDRDRLKNKPTKVILKNKQELDFSDLRKLQLKAFDFVQNKFPNKKIFYISDAVFIYDVLDKIGYGKFGGAHYKEKINKREEDSSLNSVTYWIFKDAVIFKSGN